MKITVPVIESRIDSMIKTPKRWLWLSGTTVVMLSRDRTTLNVWGVGDMDNYGDIGSATVKHVYAPWTGYKTKGITVIGDGITSDLITRVIIGRGVKYIGRHAFISCHNLTSITIPNSVKYIGNGAFAGALCPVTIPKSVISIGEYAFYNTDSIGVVVNNHEYSSIDGVLFNKDKNLLIQYPRNRKNTVYNIPNGVTSIVPGAFEDTRYLTTVSIPNSMDSISRGAFTNCTSLTSISIPNNVTFIGDGAFRNCFNLTSVTIPHSVTYVGDYAFGGECGLFWGGDCKRLGQIAIPNSLIYIGKRALYRAASINVATDNPQYASIDGVLFNKDKTELIQYPSGHKKKEYIIPDGVTLIRWAAFSDCTDLMSITIPNSIKKIVGGAFDNCKSLTFVTILNPNPPATEYEDLFRGLPSNACLYVPKGSVDVYRNAGYPWSEIECIEALP